MRYGLPLSVFFHGLMIAVVLIGWPVLGRPLVEKSVEVPVEVVRFDEIPNPPKGRKEDHRDERKPDAEDTAAKKRALDAGRRQPLARPETAPEPPAQAALPKPAEAPDRTPAVPEPKKAEAAPKAPVPPPPPPAPKAEAPPPKPVERDVAALRPPQPPAEKEPQLESRPTFRPDKASAETRKPEEKPKAAEKPKAQEKSKADDKPKIASRPTFRPDKPRPEKPESREAKARAPAPAKPDRMKSIFDSLDAERKAPRTGDADRTARDQKTGDPSHRSSLPLSDTEINAVVRQIRRCWIFDAAAKDMGSLKVYISVVMNRDGTVREARIAPRTRITGAAHRAAAESALRAVQNERCQPYRLPADKFDRWERMELEFDPADA